MRGLKYICVAAAGLAAGCTQPSPTLAPLAPMPAATAQRPTDTGNMAYPVPRATGEFNRPAPTGVDTGNMAYPNVNRQGQSTQTTRSAPDTGNMAYPTPRATGQLPAQRTY